MGRLWVFVYGTLKPGGVGYAQFCRNQVIASQPAIAVGQLYHLPAGYPAMAPEEGWVRGVVLEFKDEQILAQLDAYEDYDPERAPGDNLYYRQLIQIYTPDRCPLGVAWGYLMARPTILALGGQLLPCGEWNIPI
uniref:AIG2 family protein n=1 Tax=Cyanothece sp. (strain PCC 7425 / ATCC 29141) TaxID=395961 RepID=B8HPN0_CYAP4